ncbi:phosphoesterase [Polaribacter reichenbachii]|uniref:Phosphoesterase n=1 Tax=Polaribacter reichenbachii TaxID=996801 RepID=A0A1B8U5U2_9FLAO|nr:metallophosphoesterase [Polaribacter reichenbachii]APZ46054.1 phosphoesterase [Polaribacter reichenbachii]AUC19916.1 phosphoesterase [Polaribacter reichenbachii]OBY67229.1 phosphoesterase [Polaribacter reichenbachii]
MLRWLIPLIIVTILAVILEIYTFNALKTISKNKFLRFTFLIASCIVYINFFITVFSYDRSNGQTPQFQMAMGLLLTFLIPKLVLFLLLFGEDVYRWIVKGISAFSSSETQPLAGRRKFISQLALGLAAIPFVSFIYGIIQGKYNYKVIKYQLSFDDLPAAFDGYTITQISDIHSGSFTNKEKIQYGVDLINEQKSDLMLFTGDIVNNQADEMDGWIDVFAKLEAKEGKYAILGNHDYGDYMDWKTPEDKTNNFKKVKEIHQKIGFDLLLDEHRYLEKDGQKIALLGVENWGKGFNQAGDLQKASANVKKEDFKILMSHDPSHWQEKVKMDDFNYHLTLSGHTHGLQMGIEIPGFFKWSPSQYVYKQWAGLYQEFGRFINVNRGFGYHAFPGRVGIWPEITVIELKKA